LAGSPTDGAPLSAEQGKLELPLRLPCEALAETAHAALPAKVRLMALPDAIAYVLDEGPASV
jgi:hypothetical protein